MKDRRRTDKRIGGEPTYIGKEGIESSVAEYEQSINQMETAFEGRLLDNISDAILITDKQFTLIALNKVAEEMYGWRAEEAIGRDIKDIVQPESRAEEQNEVLRILDQISRFRTDVIHHHRDGSPIYVEATAIALRSEDGFIQGYATINRDINERRRTEEALRFQARLLDTVEQAIIATDMKGKIIYWNRFAEKLYGWSETEALGQKVLKTIPVFATKEQTSEVMSCLRRGESWSGEFLMQRRDGTIFPVLVTDSPFFDEKGEVAGVVGISIDITERKRMEEALRESEDRYRDLVEHSHDLICTHDLDGLILSVNQVAVRAMGYNPDDFINKRNIRDILAPGVKEQFDDYIAQIRRDGFATGLMAVQTRSGERRIWKYHNTLRTEGVSKPIVRGMAHDITESLRSERALQEREEWFKGIFEGSRDAIFLVDAEARFVEVNNAACELTSYSREELLSMSIPDLHEEDDLQAFRDYFSSILSGQGVTSEAMILRKDGKKVPAEFSNRRMIFRGIPVMHTTARDISDRKYLEERLQQLERMEAIGRLAGGVAHDFNNMLTAILGYSELLLSQLDNSDVICREIKEIEKAGKRAAALTNQLLAFSRRQVVQPKILNLNSVVADLENMIQRLMGEDIELIIRLDPAMRNVKADRGQIEQVITNLAVNARDAMPDGGTILIETACIAFDNIAIEERATMRPDSYVMLSVTDTGMGMSQEVRSHAFEPFFTTKEVGKGTGLGLSIVYGIVQQSGGYIWVGSEIDKGTTFKIYLPRVNETEEKRVAIDSSAQSFAGSETILLVEDEESVRKLALHILQANGYRVLEAANAREAISLEKKYKGTIHLLITDMVMPSMGGKELSQHLLASRPEIRMIYMSGYTDNNAIEGLTHERRSIFMRKPFSTTDLLQNIRSLLSN